MENNQNEILENIENSVELEKWANGVINGDYDDDNNYQLYLDAQTWRLLENCEASSNSWLERDDGSLIGIANHQSTQLAAEYYLDEDSREYQDAIELIKKEIMGKISEILAGSQISEILDRQSAADLIEGYCQDAPVPQAMDRLLQSKVMAHRRRQSNSDVRLCGAWYVEQDILDKIIY